MSEVYIGWARTEDGPALTEIWESCFGDSPEYVSFFFENYLSRCRALTARVEGKVVGSVYLISANAKDGDAVRPVVYIYALGVLPAYRSCGVAAAMMKRVFAIAEKEGAFCLLRPAGDSLVPYYRRLGMRESYYAKSVRLFPDTPQNGTFSPVSAAEYARARQRMPCLPGFIKWEDSHVNFAVAENERAGGLCGKYTAGEKSVYLLMQRQGDGYLITEALPQTDPSLLRGLCTHFPGASLFLRLPAAAEDREAFVLGMTYNKIEDGTALPGLLLD